MNAVTYTLYFCYSLFSDLRSLAGTTLMNLLAALFMVQLLFIVGVGGVQVSPLNFLYAEAANTLKKKQVPYYFASRHFENMR